MFSKYQREFEEIFEKSTLKYDTNKDGELDLNEFKNYIRGMNDL